MKWNLLMALKVIREIQPPVKILNWHVCLGGGVLNTGYSNKDLDLYFLPRLIMDKPNRPQLLEFIERSLGALTPLRPDMTGYTEELPFTLTGKLTYKNNLRIDVFIL